jgi:hypothetical protein
MKKKKSSPAARRLGGPPEPDAPPLSRCWAAQRALVFPRYSSHRVGRPRNHRRARPPFLVSLMDRPHMSVVFSTPSRGRAGDELDLNRIQPGNSGFPSKIEEPLLYTS